MKNSMAKATPHSRAVAITPALLSALGLLTVATATSASAQCTAHWIPGTTKTGVGNQIWAMTVWDPDGPGPRTPLVVVCGTFQTAGAAAAAKIAAFDPIAEEWSTFGTGIVGTVYALATLANGDLVAGGNMTGAGDVAVSNLAKWDGSSWSVLGSGVSGGAVLALKPLANGDLVAAGSFTAAGGSPASRIARWNGTEWLPLGTGLNARVNALALLPNGDLIAGGEFNTAGGNPASRVARWDGAAWSAFGDGPPTSEVRALAVLPNGNVIAGGYYGLTGLGVNVAVSRWNGAAWVAMGNGIYGTGTTNVVNGLITMPNGDVVAAGQFEMAGTVAAKNIARWNGSVWSAFAPSGAAGWFNAIALMPPNGDVGLGGLFSSVAGNYSLNFARYAVTSSGPIVTNHPQPLSPCVSDDAMFSVSTTGGVPQTFAWYHDGKPLDFSANPSAATATLTIRNVRGLDAGDYRCVVSNTCRLVTSDPATLSMCGSDFTCDRLVDESDFAVFSSAYDLMLCADPLMPAGCPADLNGDGFVDDTDFSMFVVAYGQMACK